MVARVAFSHTVDSTHRFLGRLFVGDVALELLRVAVDPHHATKLGIAVVALFRGGRALLLLRVDDVDM